MYSTYVKNFDQHQCVKLPTKFGTMADEKAPVCETAY